MMLSMTSSKCISSRHPKAKSLSAAVSDYRSNKNKLCFQPCPTTSNDAYQS